MDALEQAKQSHDWMEQRGIPTTEHELQWIAEQAKVIALIAVATEIRNLNAILHNATDLTGAVKISKSQDLLAAGRAACSIKPAPLATDQANQEGFCFEEDIMRVTKRLEIALDKTHDDLRADQARVVADRWINQNERNEDVSWEFEMARISRRPDESWVVAYTQ